MTRLFWVRHGPTHARTMVGWTDLPADLSDRAALGRLDAALPRGAVILSSDLSRAVATADALGQSRDRLPHDPDLREIHFGAWENRSHDAISAEAPDHVRSFWETPGDIRPPGGESWDDLSARVTRATDRLLAQHAGRDIVVVAHFGAILAAVQRARGCSATEVLAHRIEPLSVTALDFGPGGWACGPVNHLP
jgi:broad specificity phosphatase PhoE